MSAPGDGGSPVPAGPPASARAGQHPVRRLTQETRRGSLSKSQEAWHSISDEDKLKILKGITRCQSLNDTTKESHLSTVNKIHEEVTINSSSSHSNGDGASRPTPPADACIPPPNLETVLAEPPPPAADVIIIDSDDDLDLVLNDDDGKGKKKRQCHSGQWQQEGFERKEQQ
jgi:hypothetical protein